jgi:protein involved in polysaccharide export with SLBB domain
VFIEGALEAEAPAPEEAAAAEEEAAEDDAEADYVRISELYRPGLMLSEVLIEIRDRIGQFAELERTSVVRAQTDEVVEVNGTELLYGYGDAEDVRLGPYDTVFIPSRQISVLVTGPVGAPGLYLYVPGKSPEYYIRRAGGYDREISTSGEYVIYGSNGERRTDASDVRPGDRIEVERDNFVYQFNRHTPVILSTLTLVTTVISVLTLINQ